MANKFRFRHGQKDLRLMDVESATVIERGDLIWADVNTDVTYAVPASAFTWTSNLATTQGNFAALFVGVAQDSSAAGQTAKINVDVSPVAVYEYACPSATYTLDDTLGCDESSSTLMDQQLEKATAAASIARVAETSTASATTVLVTLHSAITASSNVNANIG